MTLQSVTREIIQLVEKETGIPVRVTEDPKLPVFAAVRMARAGGLPVHLITYKQSPGEAPDYQICFECTYILRLFANPSEKRFDLVGTAQARAEVERMMTAPDGVVSRYQLRQSQAEELRSQFLNGLLVHLRSVPIGLRVSEWLSAKYPELEELEKEHVQQEININRQSMTNEIKEITPPRVFHIAQSINAAYAWYWSEIYGKPEWFNPYRLNGFEKEGQKLVDFFEQGLDDPEHDQTLVDAWGKYLRITDWYSWAPYRSPTEV